MKDEVYGWLTADGELGDGDCSSLAVFGGTVAS